MMKHKPMLAYPVSDKPIDYSEPVFVQPKLDGVRCLIQCDKGVVTAWSRTGKPWLNIDHILFNLQPFFKFHPNVDKMNVISLGTNQIARYALHAHHSLVEAYFTGNAVISSPRDGMVAHNSRVHMLDNVIFDADGTGIFLEDATETGKSAFVLFYLMNSCV